MLEALFPGTTLAELTGKTRDELLSLIPPAHGVPLHHHHNHPQTSIGPGSNGPSPDGYRLVPPPDNDNGADDSAPMSESGEAPAERQWNEPLDEPATAAGDDINAISLVTDHQHARSYLGMTSISAVLRAIFRLYPVAKEHTAQCARAWAAIQQPQVQSPFPMMMNKDPALGLLREQRCIDFYFDHVHSITPLLDEEDFRKKYATGIRQDISWLGLLHMVFVLGSIASGSDDLHEQYYREARKYVNMDSLAAGNLECLQSICLLGGYYLHYRNSPNVAYGILGMAHRFGIALGLHREPRRHPTITDAVESQKYWRRVEARRRTWWSLFCLDTWASMTQGRPTCGRWDNTTMDTLLPARLHQDDHAATSLQASINFCLICDRIQHRFAQFSRLSPLEALALDGELLAWYDSLPPMLTQTANSPSRLLVAREFMRNRYLNVRMILSRASLLYIAHDRVRKPEDLSAEEHQLVDVCCQVSCEAIDSIALYWTANRVHVWNSAWYLFQACMVPLLSIAIEKALRQSSSPESLAAWRASLAKALETFREMRPLMRATDRAPDIIAALYEALTADTDGPIRTPSATDGSIDLYGWCDEQLTELDWSTFLGDENLTRGIFPVS